MAPLAQTGLSCSPVDLVAVRGIVGDVPGLAERVCASVSIAEAGGPQAAVLRYLAQSSAPASLDLSHSMNVQFTLFSGYLVFIMQAGFAMVRAGVPNAWPL